MYMRMIATSTLLLLTIRAVILLIGYTQVQNAGLRRNSSKNSSITSSVNPLKSTNYLLTLGKPLINYTESDKSCRPTTTNH